MSAFGSVVADVVSRQATPTMPVIAGTLLVTVAAVVVRPVWRVARHVVTIAHEGAHGLVALACGRRLSGIRLHSDTSGVTVSSGRPSGLGMILTTLAGYLGPALLGLAAAWTLSRGFALALLWGALVMLALLLLQIRNWFGLLSVLVTGCVVFAVTWWAPEQAQSAFAYLVAWFLLVAAPRPVVELAVERSRRGITTSDADQLARLTGLPAPVWLVVFGAATLGSLGYGGLLLLA